MMAKKQKDVGDGDAEGTSKSLPHLPCDIIVYDILTRIPINCLMSFRSVCKSWSSLILNDSDFIKLHSVLTCPSHGFIDLSSNYPDSHFYVENPYDDDSNDENPTVKNSDVDNSDDKKNSDDKDSDDENSDDENSDYEDEDREPELEETEAFQDWQSGVKKSKGISFYDVEMKQSKLFYFRKGLFNKKLKIRGSFSGLVVLACEEGFHEFSHHVYNPITRNSIKLPGLNELEKGFIERLPHFHIVFDPVMEKYKVVCIAWNFVEIQPRQIVPVMTRQFFFKIITLGAGSDSWRDIDIPEMGFCFRSGAYKTVSVNGCLNMVIPYDRKILRIDVSRESYYTIEYPEGASKTSKLLEIEGSLCILDYTDNTNLLSVGEAHNNADIESKGRFTLWILTEETKKWINKYNIDMFHDTSVARPYNHAPVFVTSISNPTLKIIFSVTTGRNEYENDDDEDRYYSYDVELEKLESIFRPYPLEYRQWHFNRLTHI